MRSKVVRQHEATLPLAHRRVQVLFALHGEHLERPGVWNTVEQQVACPPQHMVSRQLATDGAGIPPAVEYGLPLRNRRVERLPECRAESVFQPPDSRNERARPPAMAEPG